MSNQITGYEKLDEEQKNHLKKYELKNDSDWKMTRDWQREEEEKTGRPPCMDCWYIAKTLGEQK